MNQQFKDAKICNNKNK